MITVQDRLHLLYKIMAYWILSILSWPTNSWIFSFKKPLQNCVGKSFANIMKQNYLNNQFVLQHFNQSQKPTMLLPYPIGTYYFPYPYIFTQCSTSHHGEPANNIWIMWCHRHYYNIYSKCYQKQNSKSNITTGSY